MASLERLVDGAQRLGLALTDSQLRQFEKYQDLILDWNQRMNLTAVHDSEMLQERHFLDSLTCILATGDLDAQSVVDVGSGAGLPGIPLKICFPGLNLTLLDSVKKKTRFLQVVVEDLELAGVSIHTRRAEEVGHLPEFREAFDWAVARAVAPLRTLLEYLLPLTRLSGHAVAQKGFNAPTEVLEAEVAVSSLGGAHVELIPVQNPGQDQPAYLVKVTKVKPTPDQYPRRSGVPAKRPL
ncbi:MAG: 16S rRNA (guanine(527)-N(7))-methyltransferase RsmG [Candidatus Promineifilaceae bacterium]|nr:16S rRNA (guanine(527)-N(7))-methyltransferase RsmG [Candidatus Promineifilaceae bacterium]